MRKCTILFLGLMLVFTTLAFSQERVITGKITSGEDGSPLPGASVVVKGTTTGTITDVDGNFTLSVPTDGILLVSLFVTNGKTRQKPLSAQKRTTGIMDLSPKA